jgi:siroheme synthase-like protein
MKVYPIFLNDLSRRRCIVIGGGHEAERKVEGLLACDATITLIASAITSVLQAWAEAGRVTWIGRDYEPGDLKGAFLVICENTQPERNEQIWQEGEAEGALVNVMDDIPHCNFVAGSVIRQGALVISISSSGAAPALAVRLRQRLEREFGPEYAEFLQMMQALREPMAACYPAFAERRDHWYKLVDSDILDHLRLGQYGKAYQRLAEIVGATGLVTATGGD